jgi:hypothetical protein
MTRRLLLLSCSARKRNDPAPLPAIDRYDGPLWRVVRGYLRENPLFAAYLDIFALSAVYGLLPATQPIPWYEQKMTPTQADALQPSVVPSFQTLMTDGTYQEMCLALSQLYWRAMRGWESFVPPAAKVTLADGPLGTKQGQVRAWLHGEPWEPPAERPTRIAAPEHPRGTATLCGITLQMSREAVLEQARQFLNDDRRAAGRYRDWYVLVDGQRVSAKGLVSRLSGFPTSRFDAGRARSILLALGVDIEREP